MRTIGLIGGMSWESTIEYYRLINEAVARKRGGLSSARIVMQSLDFAEIAAAQTEDRWDDLAAVLTGAAVSLERAGADLVLICTNTMHKVADQVSAAIGIPLLHIGEVTGAECVRRGMRTVALLGTRFTMEQGFYRDVLAERFGLDVLTPPAADMELVHEVIFDELCQGRREDASRAAYIEIIERLAARGAEGVILGCTEIPLLLEESDVAVPLLDTTALHCAAAVAAALED